MACCVLPLKEGWECPVIHPYKAISVRQPFASLIASGLKRLEIRSWETDYRGPLLICAGLKPHDLFVNYDSTKDLGILELDNQMIKRELLISKTDLLRFGFGSLGVMICLVDLVGVRPFLKGNMMMEEARIDWKPNHFAWELENVRLVERKEVKGKLRLFNVPYNDVKILENGKQELQA